MRGCRTTLHRNHKVLSTENLKYSIGMLACSSDTRCMNALPFAPDDAAVCVSGGAAVEPAAHREPKK